MQQTNLWSVKARDWASINVLVKEMGISPLTAQLLVNRGIGNVDDARVFFEPSLANLDALEKIPGCSEAAAIITEVIKGGEKVIVFGDYDADGVTATALLVKGLRTVGADVDYYIPNRFSEGYDLNQSFMELVVDKGYGLVITVDCGIKAFECIDLAREKGLRTIITDHHQPADSVPRADAVINPKLNDDPFTKELAGVGVAFALVLKVWRQSGVDRGENNRLREMLELAAIGTISDSVSLLGCNRIIVSHGLKQLGETANIGLSSLFEIEGLQGKKEFEVTDISFKIGPCINAVGRLGDANEAVALLISESSQEAWELAKKLHKDNAVRQTLDGTTFLEAVEAVEQEVDLSSERVIVLASENWHPGVIGITASRVVQKFNRPAVLIAVENGIGKGSGRSRGDFNLNEAFKFCRDLLIKFGGHKQAGGFSIAAEQISEFRRCINQYAADRCESTSGFVEADAEVFLPDIDFEVVEELERLKPFGPGNPVPLLICRNVHVDSIRNVGKKNEHLKLVVSSMETEVDCIGFKLAEKMRGLKQGDCADLLFSPQINQWNGCHKIQFLLSDIRERSHSGSNSCSHSNVREFKTPDSTSGSTEPAVVFPGVLNRTEEVLATRTSHLGTTTVLEYIRSGQRMAHLGFDNEEQLLLALPTFKQSGVIPVILFPLQSLAGDFERRVAECYPALTTAFVDCVTPRAEIRALGEKMVQGAVDLLITSVGSWKANQGLLGAFDLWGTRASKEIFPCLFIHLGHWGTMFPGAELIKDVREVLSAWSGSALFLGSGLHLSLDSLGCTVFDLCTERNQAGTAVGTKVGSQTGTSAGNTAGGKAGNWAETGTGDNAGNNAETQSEHNSFIYQIFTYQSQDKIETIRHICSVSGKNLVFVNSGREAMRLRRELSGICGFSSGQVRSFFGGLLQGQKEIILEDFNQGTSRVLVASRNLDTFAVQKADSVIIYAYPLNTFDFNRFLVAPNVHLTYNNLDFEKSKGYVNSLCPDDVILEYVARNLRYSGNASMEDLHRRMSRGLHGCSSFSRRALSVALAILSEPEIYRGRQGTVAAAKESWRYLEAKKEVDNFLLLADRLGSIQSQAAASLDE